MEKLPQDFQSFDLIVVNKKDEKKEDSKEEKDEGQSDQEEKAGDEDKEAEDPEDQKEDDVKSDAVIAKKVETTKEPKASWEKFKLKEENSKKMQRITIRPWKFSKSLGVMFENILINDEITKNDREDEKKPLKYKE